MGSRLILAEYTSLISNSATTIVPISRGGAYVGSGGSIALQQLPTDPVGSFALILENVVPSSSIQISSVSGISLYNGVADVSTNTIVLDAYAGGSALNSLVIKVRKGSGSPFYRPFETYTTAIVGPQSIYVSQIPEE